MLGPVFVRTDTSRGIETFFGIINIGKGNYFRKGGGQAWDKS